MLSAPRSPPRSPCSPAPATGSDPLASLAARIPDGAAPTAVPGPGAGQARRCAPASPTRATAHIPPVDRLRHATALPGPRVPAPRPPGAPDLAAARAARLPDQLWPDWALRLTSDTSVRHGKFRPFALIGLLLPHSDMQFRHIATMVSSQLKREAARHHSPSSRPALRILTELAFTIDGRDIPIDYRRRRDLAASSTLIDEDAWAAIARATGPAPAGAPAPGTPAATFTS